jgi:hypothetical protein
MHSLNEIQADLDGPQQAFPVAAGGVVCSNLHSAAGSHNHSVYKEPGTLPVAGCKAHFAESVAKHPEWECAILSRRIVRLNETKLAEERSCHGGERPCSASQSIPILAQDVCAA